MVCIYLCSFDSNNIIFFIVYGRRSERQLKNALKRFSNQPSDPLILDDEDEVNEEQPNNEVHMDEQDAADSADEEHAAAGDGDDDQNDDMEDSEEDPDLQNNEQLIDATVRGMYIKFVYINSFT